MIDMLKVHLVAMEQDKENILSALQDEGCLEIVNTEPVDEEWFDELTEGGNSRQIEELERGISDLEFALRFISERVPGAQISKGLSRVSEEELSRIRADKEEIFRLVESCRTIETEENNLANQKSRYEAAIEKLLPWVGLDFSLAEIKDSANVGIKAGSILLRNAPPFEAEMEQFNFTKVSKVEESKDTAYYLFFSHKNEAEELWDLARRHDFAFESFEGYTGEPKTEIVELEKKIAGLEEQKNLLIEKTNELAEEVERIKLLVDAMQIDLSRERATGKLLNSGKTFLLKGWVRYDRREALEKLIAEVSAVHILEFAKPDEDEPFPVSTSNNALVTPFEMVTNLYSVPASGTLDPNPVVAPFHAMFMGMMVGDVAYGLLMVIATTVFMKLKDPEGGARKLMGVIRSAGIFSILWGVLFGSYFGDFGAKLGIRPLVVDPIEEPLVVLGLCLGLGFIHVFIGMGVQAYMYIKEGKFMDAVYDVLFWYLVLLGLPLMATPYANIGKWLLIIGALGVILTNGREKKNIFGKLVGGLGSLYGVTGYLSDILSYSRLFALMLSGAVVSMVMNQLATMLGSNVIGIVFAILLFVGGHAFNLFISGLGAFVHGSRLIYVEFFGKFFVGGGRLFEPLAKETKYNRLAKNQIE